MRITVERPNDLTQRPDPGREAVEALALAGYCSGKLTSFQAGRLPGFTSRFEFEAFLKASNIFEHALSVGDLAEDLETLRKLDGIADDRRVAAASLSSLPLNTPSSLSVRILSPGIEAS